MPKQALVKTLISKGREKNTDRMTKSFELSRARLFGWDFKMQK